MTILSSIRRFLSNLGDLFLDIAYEEHPELAPEPREDGGLHCPYCGGDDFYEGPQGGMNVNLLCANRECRHWINVAIFNGEVISVEDLNRQEPIERMP